MKKFKMMNFMLSLVTFVAISAIGVHANAGSMRYIIDAAHTGHNGGGGYGKSLWLLRPFSGDIWTLKAAITFDIRPAYTCNNRHMTFMIRKPDDIYMSSPMVSLTRGTGAIDNNPDWCSASNMCFTVGGSYEWTSYPFEHIGCDTGNCIPPDRWYIEIERNHDHVIVRVSNDGNDSTFEWKIDYTFAPGTFGNDQVIDIFGDGWYCSNTPPGAAYFDFIQVVQCGTVIFADQFEDGMLPSGWEVNPGMGSYDFVSEIPSSSCVMPPPTCGTPLPSYCNQTPPPTPPTVIKLSSFTATKSYRKVILSWITESEIDNAGFNLYRAESEDGEYVKINPSLIPAEGSPTQGASYQYVDENVKNRTTYYYKLEDIDLNGTSTMHGPVSVTPRRMLRGER